MATMIQMYDPPHPGEFITETYLTPFGISGRELATHLGVSASTLARVLNGSSRVTPEMALRLAKVLGRSAESWLAMQDAFDLWKARLSFDAANLAPFDFAVA
jgi:antitoxin HigA-1